MMLLIDSTEPFLPYLRQRPVTNLDTVQWDIAHLKVTADEELASHVERCVVLVLIVV